RKLVASNLNHFLAQKKIKKNLNNWQYNMIPFFNFNIYIYIYIYINKKEVTLNIHYCYNLQ
ncbi:MAG: hypothetical protein N7Q72_05210, partial [Spiroplasma sp. Tabriz.8]|nr:hypothetical protein [Spiroplasma sp. Tabriz.8]